MGILYIIWMDDFWEKLDTSRTPFFLEEEKVAEGLPSSQAVQRGSLPLSGHDSIWGFGYLVHASLLLSCRTSSSLQALRQEVPALLSMRCLKKVSVPPSPLWVLLQWTRGEEEGTKKEEMQGFRGFFLRGISGPFFPPQSCYLLSPEWSLAGLCGELWLGRWSLSVHIKG